MNMTQDRLFAPSESTVANALIDNSGYQAMYDASIADPDAFWAEHGKRIEVGGRLRAYFGAFVRHAPPLADRDVPAESRR